MNSTPSRSTAFSQLGRALPEQATGAQRPWRLRGRPRRPAAKKESDRPPPNRPAAAAPAAAAAAASSEKHGRPLAGPSARGKAARGPRPSEGARRSGGEKRGGCPEAATGATPGVFELRARADSTEREVFLSGNLPTFPCLPKKSEKSDGRHRARDPA